MLLWYRRSYHDFAITLLTEAPDSFRCLSLFKMAQDFSREFYNGKAWKDCRNAYVSYRRGLCERCLAKGLYSPGVIVHHKIHLTAQNVKDPTVSLNFDNLELLCRNCHAAAHKPGKRYKVDEIGRIITL